MLTADASAAGVRGFVRTTTGGASVDRLNRWFEYRHGIGETCGDRELTNHKGAYGAALDIPFYVESPRIVGFVATIDGVLRSIRWEEPVANAAERESR